MRFFTKQWDEQNTVKKRKKIAAAMANATKAWVGDGEKVEWESHQNILNLYDPIHNT